MVSGVDVPGYSTSSIDVEVRDMLSDGRVDTGPVNDEGIVSPSYPTNVILSLGL